MAKRAHLDWESRSPVNLKACGAARYAMDPRTELMCAGFAFDDGPVRVVPVSHFKTADFRDVVRQLADPNVLIVAHSAMFEYLMWKYVLCRDFGFPTIDNPAKWACTLARAAMCGFPLSLDKLGEALQLPVTKDLAGKAAMLKLSSPIGFDPLTDEPYYNEDPVLKARLLPYCAIDVEVERLADKALPEQSAAEKKVWDLDLMTNMRGIKIDRPLVTAARKLTAGLTADLNERLYQLTGGAVSAASKIQEMKTYIRSKGVSVDSLDKNAVTALLSDPETPEIVKKVISIRQQVGKSSTAKFATALNVMADQDDRARGLQQYHGAHTGRSAGRLLQPLNFPKGIGEAEQKALVADILLLSAEEFVAKHKHKSMAALSNVLRGIFIADKGKRLDVADFASIEAKVVFWLADDKPALEAYEKGVNLYVDMAKFIYKRDDITKHGSPLEYAVGKETILGAGFGMGKDKFFGNCQLKGIDITMDQSEMAIKGYRELHKPVVNLWYATERAAANAIRTPGSIQTCAGGRIAYGMSKDRRFLICRLPSYRPLFYYKPFLRPGFTPWGTECEKIYYSASDDKGRLSVFDTYGGSLVENYVQGVARDFMINGLFNVEGAGYPSILTVYDEIVSEPDEDHGSLEEFMRLMCQTPGWGKGCPVTAEGFSAKRYRK